MSKKTEEKNEVATVATTALPAAAVELMGNAKFHDEFEAGDLFLPWLQRVQTSSQYMKRGSSEYVAEAREGDIIDNLTKVLRQTQAVIFVKFERHFTTFAPGGGKLIKQWFQDRSGYDAASFPEGRDFGKKIDADGNEVQETPIYYILMVNPETGEATPATMGWGSTQAKKVKKVNALARQPLLVGGKTIIPPIYSRIFEIGTNIEQGDDGKSWAGWTFKVAGLTAAFPEYGPAWWGAAEAFREQIELGNVRPAPPADQAAVLEPEDDDTGDTPTPRQARKGTVTDVPSDDIPF